MEKSRIVIGSVTGFEAQELNNHCVLKISETVHCTPFTVDGHIGQNTGN